MAENDQQRLISPTSVADASRILASLGCKGQAYAGGTWVMRAPVRGEIDDRILVSLEGIETLHDVTLEPEMVSIGSMATHQKIADALADAPDLGALQVAAATSANPSVRRMATIGGNVCAAEFMASDLVPALMALEATVLLRLAENEVELSIEEFVMWRNEPAHGEVLSKIRIPRGDFRSAHSRNLLRRAGEYPVANLSLKHTLDGSGLIDNIRIAVGAVEGRPKRWRRLEDDLAGKSVSGLNLKKAAMENLSEFSGRHGPDAPGWYRLRVLPRLLSDAFAQTTQEKW